MGRKGKSKIVFDKEVVTKETAEKLVAQHEITEQVNKNDKQSTETANFKRESDENLKKNGSAYNSSKPKKKKKRKQKVEEEVIEAKKQKADDPETPDEETDEAQQENESAENLNTIKPEVKREDSIRAIKRKKHAALMQEKKLKAELALQQKCLNYLSQWKHNKSEWKFEKLKQVWLQQNMLSVEKVPEEMWDTLVEYFGGCKGKARETIIKDALKVIEADDDEENQEKEETEDDGVKLKRARDIIQNLQE